MASRRMVSNASLGKHFASPFQSKMQFSRTLICGITLLSCGVQSVTACRANPTPQALFGAPGHNRAFHNAPILLSSKSKFTYGIAAAYTAKDKPFNEKKNSFDFNPLNPIIQRRKNPNTRPASGEDAFFVSQIGETGDVAFGVADGVGGWASSGVDPADFSHGFCDFMAYAAKQWPAGMEKTLSAQALMQKGYNDIVKDGVIKAGGSTASVCIARENGELDVANLGDSGFVQLRLNAVHNYSEPQTHAFNTPYQLSIIPKYMQARNQAFGGALIQDMPKDASVTKHDLRHGDVLIFGTDGVWDNLSTSDVLRVVSRIMRGSKAWELTHEGIKVSNHLEAFTVPDEPPEGEDEIPSLQNYLAVGVASEAKAASVNTRRDGPFAREVQKHYPEEHWRGGKVDDICVVVAVVLEVGR